MTEFSIYTLGVLLIGIAIGYLLGLAKRDKRTTAALERVRRRYQWAANELLACDHGDNEKGGAAVGWWVYGWRDRARRRLIYGPTIDAAIDHQIREEG